MKRQLSTEREALVAQAFAKHNPRTRNQSGFTFRQFRNLANEGRFGAEAYPADLWLFSQWKSGASPYDLARRGREQPRLGDLALQDGDLAAIGRFLDDPDSPKTVRRPVWRGGHRFYELTEASPHEGVGIGVGTVIAGLLGLGLVGGAAYLALGSDSSKKRSPPRLPAASGRNAMGGSLGAPSAPRTHSTAAAPRPTPAAPSYPAAPPTPFQAGLHSAASGVAGSPAPIASGDTSQWQDVPPPTDDDTSPPSPGIVGPLVGGALGLLGGPAAGLMGTVGGTLGAAAATVEHAVQSVPDPVSAVASGISNLFGNGGDDTNNS